VGTAEWGHWLALAAIVMGLLAHSFPAARLTLMAAAAIALSPCIGAWYIDAGFSWTRLATGWTGSPLPTREVHLPQGQTMDVFIPSQRNAPGVLVVHGGSWARGSRKDFRALSGHLRWQGYFVANLDYRLAPASKYPAANEDLDAAFDYVVAHASELHLDPQRICWLGRSAGAHLALLQAYVRRPSRCVIGYYAPSDMLWSYEHPSNPRVLDSPAALRDFLGGPPSDLPEVYTQASPLQRAHAEAPPTLLLHGLNDDLVYAEQSRRLQRRLSELAVPCQTLYMPWANHGCDINLSGPSGQMCTLTVERFLKQYLVP
jgi:acetyl esterase/lipase